SRSWTTNWCRCCPRRPVEAAGLAAAGCDRQANLRRTRMWIRILLATGSAVVALGLSAFWLEPASLALVEERIRLPGTTHGSLRIAVLTDLHVGSPFNGIEKLRKVVDRTNAA